MYPSYIQGTKWWLCLSYGLILSCPVSLNQSLWSSGRKSWVGPDWANCPSSCLVQGRGLPPPNPWESRATEANWVAVTPKRRITCRQTEITDIHCCCPYSSPWWTLDIIWHQGGVLGISVSLDWMSSSLFVVCVFFLQSLLTKVLLKIFNSFEFMTHASFKKLSHCHIFTFILLFIYSTNTNGTLRICEDLEIQKWIIVMALAHLPERVNVCGHLM